MYVYVYSHVGAYVYTIVCEGCKCIGSVFLDDEQLGVGDGCTRGGGYSNLTER